jgi:hypothetical protein
MREEHFLILFETRTLRRTFGPAMEDITRRQWKLHEENRTLHQVPSEGRWYWWGLQSAWRSNGHTKLDLKLERNRPLEKLRIILKWILQKKSENASTAFDYSDKLQTWVAVNRVLKLRVAWKAEIFWTLWVTISFSIRSMLHGYRLVVTRWQTYKHAVTVDSTYMWTTRS